MVSQVIIILSLPVSKKITQECGGGHFSRGKGAGACPPEKFELTNQAISQVEN